MSGATDIEPSDQIALLRSDQSVAAARRVWFGEMPLEMDRIEAALSTCDLFVSVGTSGSVYPAAGFVQQAAPRQRAHGRS